MSRTLLAALLLLCGTSLGARACWHEVAQRHGVPADLLYAVAKVESNLNPRAVNRSHFQRTGSVDIGLMQINSRHLPTLARRGITQESLYEPCVNLDVGAWLLADLFSRRGLSWDSVGAYNAACTQLKGESCTRARATYAWKVYRHLPSVGSTQSAPRDRSATVANATQLYRLHVKVAP